MAIGTAGMLALMGGSAAGGILGGLMGSNSSEKAADTYQETAMAAIDAQMKMFNKTMEMYAPFQQAGASVLPEMESEATLSGTDPLYQWKKQQFDESTDRALAARGLWNSGYGLKTQLQGEAGLEAQNTQEVWNRQSNLANIGLGATTGAASAATTTGSNVASTLMTAGQLEGAAQLQQGQYMSGLYSGLGNLPMQTYTTQQQGNLMNSMMNYYNQGKSGTPVNYLPGTN